MVARFVRDSRRVLEIGAGTSTLLQDLGPTGSVTCDLTVQALLRQRPDRRFAAVAAAGEHLPFRDGSFDAIYAINVLEHAADVVSILDECSRVLQSDGRILAITPNGNWERLLDLAERLRLKIPEGPHRFLRPDELRNVIQNKFDVIEHSTFLSFPCPPDVASRAIDRLVSRIGAPWGFFQFVVGRLR